MCICVWSYGRKEQLYCLHSKVRGDGDVKSTSHPKPFLLMATLDMQGTIPEAKSEKVLAS